MSYRSFPLTIASVDRVLFDGDVEFVTCPGTDGELTVLARHMPLATTLRSGRIIAKTKEGERAFDVERGILEVSRNRAFVLV